MWSNNIVTPKHLRVVGEVVSLSLLNVFQPEVVNHVNFVRVYLLIVVHGFSDLPFQNRPYFYIENGEFQGIDVEIIRELSRKLNFRFCS